MQSEKTAAGDDVYTPFFAVTPLLEFIPKHWCVWFPFDEEWSAFYHTFKENGYSVIRSSLSDGKDFFEYQPKTYDVIISNPPYSKKDEVIERLYMLGKPFAMLMPVSSLQGKKRYKSFKSGLELLVFDSRIDYHTRQNFSETRKGVHFGSVYFCRGILPEKLVFRELNKFNRPLK